MKKTIVIAVVLGVGAGIGGRMALRGDAGPQPTNVSAASPAADMVSANGTVEGARPEVGMRPEVTGILVTLKARENDAVEKGQVLAELSNASQKAQVELARGELAAAREHLKKLKAGERAQVIARAQAEEEAKAAAHEQARKDADRAQMTAGGLSASDRDGYHTRLKLAKADWDKAKADLALALEGARAEDLAAAQAQVEVAEAKVHAAAADLAKTRLTAPTSGRVLQVFAEPGEMASPTSTQPVLIMADLSKRRVRAFVEELDIDRIEVGQPAFVTADGLPGRTFTGKVAVAVLRMGKRAPQSDAPNELKDVYFREVLIDLDGGDDLPTNLRVQVRIQAKQQEKR
jgi:multidrug resistance efflux pump